MRGFFLIVLSKYCSRKYAPFVRIPNRTWTILNVQKNLLRFTPLVPIHVRSIVIIGIRYILLIKLNYYIGID